MTAPHRSGLVAGLLAMLAVVPTGTLDAADTSPSGATEPRVQRSPDGLETAVHLGGAFVAHAWPRRHDGRRALVVLVGPGSPAPGRSDDESPDGEFDPPPPCPGESGGASNAAASRSRLLLVSPGEPTPVTTLLATAPAGFNTTVALDVDGDGADELLLWRPGELGLVSDGDFASWFAVPDLDPPESEPRPRGEPIWLTASGLGTFVVHGRGADDETGSVRSTVELPREASLTGRRLTLRSSAPRDLGRRRDGTRLFATTATAVGPRRLRSTLIAVDGAGRAEAVECWARLPGAEELLESAVALVDDRPLLLVLTRPADRLELLGEKLLRVFALERDRSRLGRPPLLAATSRVNLWQPVTPEWLDLDRDGRTDLVLGYWKGLKDDRVVLDVYRAVDEGGFRAEPTTTGFDVKDADRSFVGYGRDLDGDGLPDLLVRGAGRLLLHSGRVTKTGKDALHPRPRDLAAWTGPEGTVEFAVGAGAGTAHTATTDRGRLTLEVVDLDGDGRREVLFVTRAGPDSNEDTLTILRVP